MSHAPSPWLLGQMLFGGRIRGRSAFLLADRHSYLMTSLGSKGSKFCAEQHPAIRISRDFIWNRRRWDVRRYRLS